MGMPEGELNPAGHLLAQQFTADFMHEMDLHAGLTGHALVFVCVGDGRSFGHPNLNV